VLTGEALKIADQVEALDAEVGDKRRSLDALATELTQQDRLATGGANSIGLLLSKIGRVLRGAEDLQLTGEAAPARSLCVGRAVQRAVRADDGGIKEPPLPRRYRSSGGPLMRQTGECQSRPACPVSIGRGR
jgi:hypothetical protein